MLPMCLRSAAWAPPRVQLTPSSATRTLLRGSVLMMRGGKNYPNAEEKEEAGGQRERQQWRRLSLKGLRYERVNTLSRR